jgi:predicted O-methyltransferase YrrM
MDEHDFMLKGIDLQGLAIMDAGTGAANTTLWLAEQLNEAGGGKIISIHNDPDDEADRLLDCLYSALANKIQQLKTLMEG